MKKFISIILCLCMSLCLFVGCGQDDEKVELITKGEWVTILGNSLGITDSEAQTDGFSDVNVDDDIYCFVHELYKRGVIPYEDAFNKDEVVTYDYVVLSAMKTLPSARVNLLMDRKVTTAIEKEDYVTLAVDRKIVKKNQLDKEVTNVTAQSIIESVAKLYFEAGAADDYCEYEIEDSIKDIRENIMLSEDSNEQLINISDTTFSGLNLNEGDIIILGDMSEAQTSSGIAKRIVSIESTNDGYSIVNMDEPAFEEVFENLEMKDTFAISSEDILESVSSLYGSNGKTSSYIPSTKIAPVAAKGAISGTGGGTTIQIVIEDGEGSFYVNGVGFDLPGDFPSAANLDTTNTLTNFNVVSQASTMDKTFSVDVSADIDNTVTISSSYEQAAGKEGRVTLLKKGFSLGGDIGELQISLDLVFSLSGEITIQHSYTINTGVSACFATSNFYVNPHFSIPNSEWAVQANAEATLGLAPTAKASIFGIGVLETDLQCYCIGSADVSIYKDKTFCANACITFPHLLFSYNVLDGKYKGSIDYIVPKLKGEFHYEGTLGTKDGCYVNECTKTGKELDEEKMKLKEDELISDYGLSLVRDAKIEGGKYLAYLPNIIVDETSGISYVEFWSYTGKPSDGASNLENNIYFGKDIPAAYLGDAISKKLKGNYKKQQEYEEDFLEPYHDALMLPVAKNAKYIDLPDCSWEDDGGNTETCTYNFYKNEDKIIEDVLKSYEKGERAFYTDNGDRLAKVYETQLVGFCPAECDYSTLYSCFILTISDDGYVTEIEEFTNCFYFDAMDDFTGFYFITPEEAKVRGYKYSSEGGYGYGTFYTEQKTIYVYKQEGKDMVGPGIPVYLL